MDWNAEMLMALRVLAATALGGFVGWERERHGREAGVRTYGAVALGACVFTLISTHITGGNNPHVIFERGPTPSGAQYRVVFNPGNSTTRSVDNVRMLGEGTIAMRFTTLTGESSGLAFDITMLKEPARYKVIGSVGSDGKVYIKDGIVTSSGTVNPWQNKCAD